MSDHYLRLVPVDPKWQVMPEAAEAAVRVLAEMLPAAEEVSSHLEESVVFYDAGQNTISVSCPACGAGHTDCVLPGVIEDHRLLKVR